MTIFDPTADTEVHTDACKFGVAGILFQKQVRGKMTVVSYYSRQTNAAEQRYHSYELEALAVVETLKKFRIYLIGKQFKLITDCSAVRACSTKKGFKFSYSPRVVSSARIEMP